MFSASFVICNAFRDLRNLHEQQLAVLGKAKTFCLKIEVLQKLKQSSALHTTQSERILDCFVPVE